MKIAIIGGIGSGKSVALNVAKELGIATLSCDEINASLLTNGKYLGKVFDMFPSCNNNGILDKEELKKIIYSSEEERNKLNSLAHPIIYQKIIDDLRDPLVVEIPLFSKDVKKYFEEVILIDTPISKRLELLKSNRGMEEEDSIKIIDAQNSYEELKSLSTFIIKNDFTKELFIEKCRNKFKEIILHL